MRPPELKGIVTSAQVAQTGASIVAAQAPDGALPWPDGHTDAWNHIESAMGLLVAGEREASDRAYSWLRSNQAADGSWRFYDKLTKPQVKRLSDLVAALKATGLDATVRHIAARAGIDRPRALSAEVLDRRPAAVRRGRDPQRR